MKNFKKFGFAVRRTMTTWRQHTTNDHTRGPYKDTVIARDYYQYGAAGASMKNSNEARYTSRCSLLRPWRIWHNTMILLAAQAQCIFEFIDAGDLNLMCDDYPIFSLKHKVNGYKLNCFKFTFKARLDTFYQMRCKLSINKF